MPDAKVPGLGNVPKPALYMGAIGAVVVTGYLIYRHNKTLQAASTSGYGYGSSAYGYGAQAVPAGYFGYGFGYGSGGGYGTAFGGDFTQYPFASQYGYGAFGYGYYDPYTGQYLGPPPSSGGGVASPPPTNSGGSAGGGGGQKPTHTITANGHQTLAALAKANKVTRIFILELNPHLAKWFNSGKPIPRGTKVKV
jgi:hypothetical protein